MLQWTLGAVPFSNYDFLWIFSQEWDCWILWWYYFFVLFSWSKSDLQCCVSFRCITKWLGYTYTCIPSFSDSFLIQFITEYWVEFSLLYSRSFLVISSIYSWYVDFPGGTMVKNPPASGGDTREARSVPWSGRSPRVGNGNSLQYSGLEIPWTEEPLGLQSMESQRVQHDSCICLSQAPNVSLPQHFSNGNHKLVLGIPKSLSML